MERQLKQRVVGAALLVAFGVIFIPIFLDNGALDSGVAPTLDLSPRPADAPAGPALPLDEAQIRELESRIDGPLPEPPEGAPMTPPAPDVLPGPPGASEAAPAEPASVAAAPPSAASAPVPPPPAGVTPVDAWAVQLGSFASEENARRLLERLRGAGHQAYLEPQSEAGGTVFKVRVGPLATRTEAERTRTALEQGFATKGMLLPYR